MYSKYSHGERLINLGGKLIKTLEASPDRRRFRRENHAMSLERVMKKERRDLTFHACSE